MPRRRRRLALGPGPGRGLALITAAIIAAACGSTVPSPPVLTPTPWASSSAGPAASPTASPTPAPTAPPVLFPLAVVGRFDDLRSGVTMTALRSAGAAGKLVVPCEVKAISLEASAFELATSTRCLPATDIPAAVQAEGSSQAGLPAATLALLPPALVTPELKVLPIGEADLFGAPKHRALPYPLLAEAPTGAPWTAYDSDDVRTLISTGDTCPDRGFSFLAVLHKKGWNWTLSGGTARYTGFRMNTEFPGPQGKGWPVPTIRVNKDSGKVADLISDNDVSANDFECPVLAGWIQHNGGMVFSIDPRAVTLLAGRGGVKVVTLGSNHITDGGLDGVRQTLRYLDAAGVKHTGAGLTLEAALAPAVVDVRGVRFAFVGWDDIRGSAAATSSRPGVAPMTDANVCNSLQAARTVADIVIAMPQWGWPEYHNTITKQQIAQRAHFYECGADGILGSGTHWASWTSIQPGPNGPLFAIGSHGNFFFDQNWSQQTMEGVVVEATFVGTRLAQFRLHPYVVAFGAQPNLLDPSGDGRSVMTRVWSVSQIR